MNETFYEITMLFFTYSFLAWLAETSVATVKEFQKPWICVRAVLFSLWIYRSAFNGFFSGS